MKDIFFYKFYSAVELHQGNDLNSVAAPSVEVPPVAPPPADGPELVAPADAWQTVRKRRQILFKCLRKLQKTRKLSCCMLIKFCQ